MSLRSKEKKFSILFISLFVFFISLITILHIENINNSHKEIKKDKQMSVKDQAILFVSKNTNFEEKPTNIILIKGDLNNQILLNNDAKKGDVLLIYEPKRKAVLYRPSLSKIVSVINTTRGDGLDLSEDIDVTIYCKTSFKKATEIHKKIIKIWPEIKGNISIKRTELEFPKNFISPGPDAEKETYSDINNLLEKVDLPFKNTISKDFTKGKVIIYIN